ncbi:hypothetical protein CHLNCDRAFT_139284 [Chlorella variabilis]|uniref:Uncharacterized protein n=1 Tax=Chlorella variabilis TaxID=554065 RepID=E1ZPY3_CHLVA|nr:hypothetical protein CHLNCDRAFT_139284 [Chlorella variabilis]EFN52145.1 hypothetical protein CHLNCDRAFT_139284 [Chlorella variabilis]|eukprot:XP_005844247.1 hypothetical protein CHLNCDRAFT_139284 [Chlorella variabilis]
MSQAAVLQDPDLGARIEHAMRHAFSCRHERVAIAVFGPAADGGFYLLALSTLPSGLFQGIQWSTPSALANNLANARRLGLHVAPLEAMDTLPDIDTLQDLQRWCSSKQHALRQQHKHSYLQQQLQVANGVSLLEVALQVAAGCSTP